MSLTSSLHGILDKTTETKNLSGRYTTAWLNIESEFRHLQSSFDLDLSFEKFNDPNLRSYQAKAEERVEYPLAFKTSTSEFLTSEYILNLFEIHLERYSATFDDFRKIKEEYNGFELRIDYPEVLLSGYNLEKDIFLDEKAAEINSWRLNLSRYTQGETSLKTDINEVSRIILSLQEDAEKIIEEKFSKQFARQAKNYKKFLLQLEKLINAYVDLLFNSEMEFKRKAKKLKTSTVNQEWKARAMVREEGDQGFLEDASYLESSEYIESESEYKIENRKILDSLQSEIDKLWADYSSKIDKSAINTSEITISALQSYDEEFSAKLEDYIERVAFIKTHLNAAKIIYNNLEECAKDFPYELYSGLILEKEGKNLHYGLLEKEHSDILDAYKRFNTYKGTYEKIKNSFEIEPPKDMSSLLEEIDSKLSKIDQNLSLYFKYVINNLALHPDVKETIIHLNINLDTKISEPKAYYSSLFDVNLSLGTLEELLKEALSKQKQLLNEDSDLAEN